MITPVSTVADGEARREDWSLPRLLGFRFGFVYVLLFIIPLGFEFIPLETVRAEVTAGWARCGAWVGEHVLGLDGPLVTEETGSGDRTVDYVLLLGYATLASAATVCWSVFGRGQREHARLARLLHVVVRYALAYMMFAYGIIKLYGGQFPVPGTSRLLRTYGESSPMGLLWTFMGASPAYVVFAGAAETLGGALLLFRRTATLGALLLTFVLTNVVMMNLCYDVPVKINSSHYLAMCLLVMLPDLRRLANVLVFDRPALPAPPVPATRRRWARLARPVLKYGATAFVVWSVHQDVAEMRDWQRPRTWFADWWEVESFRRDGAEVPAVITDATRWRRLRFESYEQYSLVRWHNMDGSSGDLFTAAVDDAAASMTWTRREDGKPDDRYTLRFQRLDADHLRLEGSVEGAAIVVTLTRLRADKTRLLTRGFHWINERGYNR